MALRRYSRTIRINAGRQFGTARASVAIYQAVNDGRIAARRETLADAERLDVIAGREYGNAKLWWVIAAASGIGWCLQAPPGTTILIPSLGAVAALVG